MPVKSCGDGTYRIGDGPCQYDSEEKAQRAYKGYLASQVNKLDESQADADNLTEIDGIHHRTGGRWRRDQVAKSWVPVQRYTLKLPNGSKTNPLGEAMTRAGMDDLSQEALIDRVTNMGLPSRHIKLNPRDRLYASQARVETTKVSKIPLDAGGSPPILLKVGDRTVVIDGHHRVAKARARNTVIDAVLYDANLLDVAAK